MITLSTSPCSLDLKDLAKALYLLKIDADDNSVSNTPMYICFKKRKEFLNSKCNKLSRF